MKHGLLGSARRSERHAGRRHGSAMMRGLRLKLRVFETRNGVAAFEGRGGLGNGRVEVEAAERLNSILSVSVIAQASRNFIGQ